MTRALQSVNVRQLGLLNEMNLAPQMTDLGATGPESPILICTCSFAEWLLIGSAGECHKKSLFFSRHDETQHQDRSHACAESQKQANRKRDATQKVWMPVGFRALQIPRVVIDFCTHCMVLVMAQTGRAHASQDYPTN